MDKEVEEILSSSDDEDTAMDDFVPGVVNDGNDENTDSADSANNANYDDLAMSDSNSSSTSYPPAKRCKLKLDPEASEDDEDDDEWDDKAAALLDDQF